MPAPESMRDLVRDLARRARHARDCPVRHGAPRDGSGRPGVAPHRCTCGLAPALARAAAVADILAAEARAIDLLAEATEASTELFAGELRAAEEALARLRRQVRGVPEPRRPARSIHSP